MQHIEKWRALEAKTEVKKATAGFIVSLISGILILANASIVIALGSMIAELEPITIHGRGATRFAGMALATWGAIGLIFAILVIIGAVLMYMPGNEVVGGILVLVFSIFSIIIGGGFIIGLILGIIGGALGLAKM